jgi:hypothetical protein
MKKVFRFSFFFLTVLIATAACTKNDSTPSDRANYLGTWTVSESHNKAGFEVTILADPNDANRVLIDNFANLLAGNRASAFISGNNITLDQNQSVGGWTILHGSGTMTGTTIINWSYALTNGATQIDATAIYTKK